MHDALSGIRQRTWDYWLTVATVVLLGSLGVQSFLGTGYVWWAERTIPEWRQLGYAEYVQFMNAIAAPQIVALVVVMGLCVPKRLFTRSALIVVSAGMLLAGAVVGMFSGDPALGLGIYLVLAALIQVAVVVLTVAGARSPSYLTEGRLTKVGSGLLHLGFLIVCFVIVELQGSRFLLPVFWVGMAAVLLGTALSFWASRIAYRRPRPVAAQEPMEPELPLEVPDHGGDEGRGELDQLG